MRIRSIKPEFWRSSDITSLPKDARLTFIGMWSYVDDNGVGDARLSSIIGDLYAEDMARDPQECLQSVSRDLQQLENTGLLLKYKDPGHPNRTLYYVTNWTSHQLVNRPSLGHKYPLPSPEIIENMRNQPDTQANCMSVSGVSQETLSAGAGEQGSRGAVLKTLDQPQAVDRVRITRFEEFWEAYPRKVGKQKAQTKYTTQAKAHGEQTILNGAHRFAHDPNLPTDKNFIPYPTTWLERGSWADEPLAPRNNGTESQATKNFHEVMSWDAPPPEPEWLQIEEGM